MASALPSGPGYALRAEQGRDSVFNTRIKATTARIAVAAAGATAAIGLCAAPAGASASGSTQHLSFDPAGDVFSCEGGDLTATGGIVYQVFHTSNDAQGVLHYTSTTTPRHVTLADAAGNSYNLSGAITFGGKATAGGDTIVATSTAHLVIHPVSGGVSAKVQVVEHFNITPGGKINVKSFNFGSCQLPED
jgi:hypothetical protein